MDRQIVRAGENLLTALEAPGELWISGACPPLIRKR
jgi:hypothetical protein